MIISAPPTKTDPVTDILHGISVTDSYRWLEDTKSPRVRKWLGEQSIYARTYLDAIPGRERIRKRVEELLAVEVMSAPFKVGNRYFFLKRLAYQEQPVITMKEGMTGVDITLIDPAERGLGSDVAVDILCVSEEGNFLAYSVRHGGEDTHAVEIFDVNCRRRLPDLLAAGFFRGLVFSPDGRGFYYSHNPVDSKRPDYHAVRWHTFGARPEED